MKFLILLVSLFYSAKAVRIFGGFDGLMGKRPNTAMVGINDFDDNWVPTSIDFRTFVDITAPYPTEWTYSINDVVIASGTEDFCDYSEVGPGGIAIQIARYGLGFNDSDCPFPQYTTFKNREWTWLEGEPIDLDEIFEAALNIMNAASVSADAPDTLQDAPPSDPQASDPSGPVSSDSSSAGNGAAGMKRRRRGTELVTIILDTVNECVDARFALTASV